MAGEPEKPEDLDALLDRIQREHESKLKQKRGSWLERSQPKDEEERNRS